MWGRLTNGDWFLIRTPMEGIDEAVHLSSRFFLIIGAVVLIASIIYKRHKTRKTAIISMAIATIGMIIVMGFANYFVTPYYYGGEGMREMVVQLMPFILLFNLIKGVANSVITFIVYKRISPFLHKA